MTAGIAALVVFLVLRLAYVFWVGSALWRQDRTGVFTRNGRVEEGWLRFRRTASTIMNLDGIAFVVLVLLTRNSLTVDIPPAARIAVGVVLCGVGVGIKVWAAASLGPKAYYWHNFFDASDPVAPSSPGPYRWFKNPMYTLGYLQTYGLSLVFASAFGLVAAGFAQAAVLLFHVIVERPHYRELIRRSAAMPTATERK
jgi:protein-S-isoprenylcysteine O-methyltransferase Ste14